jgi:hypothetical protein
VLSTIDHTISAHFSQHTALDDSWPPDESGLAAEIGGGEGGFAAGVSGADDNHVKRLIEEVVRHSLRFTCLEAFLEIVKCTDAANAWQLRPPADRRCRLPFANKIAFALRLAVFKRQGSVISHLFSLLFQMRINECISLSKEYIKIYAL